MSGLLVLMVVFVGYALLAARLDRWSITAPMVFVLAGAIVGPYGIGILPLTLDSHTVLRVTELTLGLLLFTDAATVRLREVEGDARLPSRLLFIGLPLTIVLGAVIAFAMVPRFGWMAAFLVATILAPTDVALGLAVVTNRAVPGRIRRALNVESGLNDGLATPFVGLFLAAVTAEAVTSGRAWGIDALEQLVWALVAAVVVGAGGGVLLSRAHRHGWTSDVSQQLAVLALALLSYEGSVWIGGNGFVAAFAGGLAFGAASKGGFAKSIEFSETIGLFSSFFVWTVFGALFVGQVVTNPVWARAVVYALLSLTVIRMLPVAVSMIGMRLRPSTLLFMGWFGPRGLASVVFTLLALEEFDAHQIDGWGLTQVATWTILLSVFLHGLTAAPLSRRYGAAIRRERGIPELRQVTESRVRLRDLAGRNHEPPSA
jgi:sodium/hydrogen antiporter